MRKKSNISRSLVCGLLGLVFFGLLAPKLIAQDAAAAISKETIAALDKELNDAKSVSSEARQRLAVRRVISDAEDMVAAHATDTSRFLALEFLFRAYQRMIALDKDVENRKALLAICQELVKAPDELAELRLEADILLSQAEVAKQGANAEARAKALRPLVDRYVNTPVAAAHFCSTDPAKCSSYAPCLTRSHSFTCQPHVYTRKGKARLVTLHAHQFTKNCCSFYRDLK